MNFIRGMTIRLPRAAHAGGVEVSAGRYTVDLDGSRVVLRGGDREVALAARHRPSKALVRSPYAELRRVRGEPAWLLVVRVPPADELVVALTEVRDA